VRELFDALAGEIRKCGPVKVLPEKTRIALALLQKSAEPTNESSPAL
jgi:hypothetical protein